jgi:glycosyltransferase involved in cell wall biosynthesis
VEKVAIIVVCRDKFSTTDRCLDAILAHTPAPFDLLVVMGGAPESCREEWARRFGPTARFIFTDKFLNQSESRNIGLAEAKTRLAVLIDNDVYVRPGWLEPLVRCERETGAAMVVPLILETETRIHTAGNDFYVSYEGQRAFGHKHLRLCGKPFYENSNLKRQPTDYGELHCQLVQVEPTIRLKAFDEKLREVAEVDSGLVWAKAGHGLWLEPASVVLYHKTAEIRREDIDVFAWRWDMRGILEGYRHFEQKWGVDATESGLFQSFLVGINRCLGPAARAFPSDFGLACDRWLGRLYQCVTLPHRQLDWWLTKYMRRRFGYHDWPNSDRRS